VAVNFRQLKNNYFAMRHGQSMANVDGLVVSHPDIGVSRYGLSPLGRQQVLTSAQEFLRSCGDTSKIRIISSDFLRARQTAEILAATLRCASPVEMSASLRERFFGQLDGQSDAVYRQVWTSDAVDARHEENGVESVVSVCGRINSLVKDLEDCYSDAQLVLVAHGDVLQIAQTLFNGLPGAKHRQLPHFDVAEIRQLSKG